MSNTKEKKGEKPQLSNEVKNAAKIREFIEAKRPKSNKKWRKLVIETDGDHVFISASELNGVLEFQAILQSLIQSMSNGGK